VWHLRIQKHILWTGQSIKYGGIYPLQDFKYLTNAMDKLNNMTIHGGRNALRTLT